MPLNTQYPNINEHIVAELDELFESSPPGKLRRSIQTLLFQYLRGTHTLEGEQFHNIMTDVCYLVEFLECGKMKNKEQGEKEKRRKGEKEKRRKEGIFDVKQI